MIVIVILSFTQGQRGAKKAKASAPIISQTFEMDVYQICWVVQMCQCDQSHTHFIAFHQYSKERAPGM